MTCKIVNCSAYWDFSKSLLSFDNSVIFLGLSIKDDDTFG